MPWSVPPLWFSRGRLPNSAYVAIRVESHRPISTSASRNATSPSPSCFKRLACVPCWFACVSKLASDRRTTAMPASLAASCAAVPAALPKALRGNSAVNLRRACRRSAESITSRSTRRICASAALRESPSSRARRALRRNCSGLVSAMARAPWPARGPIALGPTTTPSAAKPAGDGDAAKARESQPASRYSSLFDAVSQISMERKCERFGCG